MSSNPAISICHGFFHNAATYQPLVDALKPHGIDAYRPQLPVSDLSKLNVGDIISPNFDLGPPSGGYPQGEEDTQAVLAVLKLLIEIQKRRVLLVAHSGGGFAATQSATPELQEKHHQSRGMTGGIVGIFYYGAFIVPIGESLHTTFQPKDGRIVMPPWLQFHKNGRAGIGTVFEPEKYLFNGLDEGQMQKWKPLLTGSPMCMTTLTNNAYETLPCAYLHLEEDRMLQKAVQEKLVAGQSEKTGAFKVYNCASGHSPHLSHTQGVGGQGPRFCKRVGVINLTESSIYGSKT